MNPQQQVDETREFLEDGLPSFVIFPGGYPTTREFIERAVARISTDGASQYYDAAEDRMLFETLDLDTVYGMIEEELLDAANYLYMLHARGGPDFIVMLRQLHSMWETLDWNRRSARQEGEKT